MQIPSKKGAFEKMNHRLSIYCSRIADGQFFSLVVNPLILSSFHSFGGSLHHFTFFEMFFTLVIIMFCIHDIIFIRSSFKLPAQSEIVV